MAIELPSLACGARNIGKGAFSKVLYQITAASIHPLKVKTLNWVIRPLPRTLEFMIAMTFIGVVYRFLPLSFPSFCSLLVQEGRHLLLRRRTRTDCMRASLPHLHSFQFGFCPSPSLSLSVVELSSGGKPVKREGTNDLHNFIHFREVARRAGPADFFFLLLPPLSLSLSLSSLPLFILSPLACGRKLAFVPVATQA